MDASIQHMKRQHPEALELFCLLGLIPGGITEADLTIIWQSDEWINLAELLRKASLLKEKIETSSLGIKG